MMGDDTTYQVQFTQPARTPTTAAVHGNQMTGRIVVK